MVPLNTNNYKAECKNVLTDKKMETQHRETWPLTNIRNEMYTLKDFKSGGNVRLNYVIKSTLTLKSNLAQKLSARS